MNLQNQNDPPRLPRVLGTTETLCAIVGSVIGSGIFIVPSTIARDVPSIGGIALVWILGGLFTLAGALTIAELGAMLPRAGGSYVYLYEAYGRLPAFLFGWTEFLIIRAGSVATLAAAFSLFFTSVVDAPMGISIGYWRMLVALAAMAIVAVINVLGTKKSGKVQVLGTGLKLAAIAAMMILPFVLGKADSSRLTPVFPVQWNGALFKGMLAAMIGVLWSYDGWVNMSSLAEDIKDPGRTIPKALFMSVAILIGVYLGLTLSYHLVLSMSEIASAAKSAKGGTSHIVASEFCFALLGKDGLTAIAIVVMCSTFISLNGNALAGPRAYFAMARDGLFPKALSRLHPRFQTPANAIVAQTVWAMLLMILGTILTELPEPTKPVSGLAATTLAALRAHPLYDLLFTYVIFGGTVFYTLAIASVFVLRVRRPDLPRPYKTTFYPFTPIFYMLSACLILTSMLIQSFVPSLAGLLIILAGIPAFAFFQKTEAG